MKRIVSVLVLLAGSHNAWAADSLDLAKAARLALDHAPAMSAAEAARDASHEQKALARAALLPSLKATGELSSIRQRSTYTKANAFLVPNVSYQRRDAGISLVQPIFRYDRWAGYEQGSVTSEIGDLQFTLQRQQLLLEVAAAYTDLLAAQEELAAANAQVESVEKLQAQAKASFEVGTATVNDALEAQSRLDLAKATAIQANATVEQQRARLTSLIGAPVDNLNGFAAVFSLQPLQPVSAEAWEKRADTASLAVLLAEKQYEFSSIEIHRTAGMAMPSLDLVASVDRLQTTNGQFGTGVTTRQSRIALELEVPLYAGGATWTRLRQARNEEVSNEYLLQDAKRQARLDARAAFLAVQSAAARIQALRQALVSAEKARQAASVGYEVGLRTIVELLDAEDRLLTARSNLATAKASYIMARLQLNAATGQLDMGQIELINTLLSRNGY